MTSDAIPFRRLQLLKDITPLDQEIVQEQATSLGRLGRALERALTELRAFDEAHGWTENGLAENGEAASPDLRPARAALRDAAGHALWQFVIQREACGLRDARQLMRDYRVPADVQRRMGAMPAKPPAGPNAGS